MVTYSLSYLYAVETIMTWHVVFHGQKSGMYDSWGVCSEYVLGFSDAVYQIYYTRM
jgi:viroplasmin and RNaseH domain-containing protein